MDATAVDYQAVLFSVVSKGIVTAIIYSLLWRAAGFGK